MKRYSNTQRTIIKSQIKKKTIYIYSKISSPELYFYIKELENLQYDRKLKPLFPKYFSIEYIKMHETDFLYYLKDLKKNFPEVLH